MIGCYATGIFPRPRELVEATRAHERGKAQEKDLESAFEQATKEVMNAQLSAQFTHVTDGMLKWQDLLRPFTENVEGITMGSLARWFNNNTFYRKPVVVEALSRKKRIIQDIAYVNLLPKRSQWKAILPAPYTFVQLSENRFYKDKTEFMFDCAKILRGEIEDLVKAGFKYVQLSDPALVYKPLFPSDFRHELNVISDALKIAVYGLPISTCLQTFFGDFSQVLPEALSFPVDHLGIDLYETDSEKLRDYRFDKGVALGVVDSRSSLVENPEDLTKIAEDLINSIYPSRRRGVFVCPNCDLEFLPWTRAKEKMGVISQVAADLRVKFGE